MNINRFLKKMETKSAVILCGGTGSRLGQLGKKIPKSLVKIQQRPIMWYIINSLRKDGFNHFILPVGFKGDQIKKFIKNNKEFRNYKIEIIDTGNNTNIAKRIYKVKKFIKSDNFLLLNGDAIFDINLKKIYESHKRKKYDISFISCEIEATFGTIETIKGRVVNFERNMNFISVQANKKNSKGFIYSGMAIMKKKILDEKFKDKENFEKDFYPQIIKKFKPAIFQSKGFWCAMDNIKDVDSLNKRGVNKRKFKQVEKIRKRFL